MTDNNTYFHTGARCGLTDIEVEESRKKHGENILTPPQRTSMWRLYLDKYNDPIIRILLVAAAFSIVLAFVEKEFAEPIGIIIAVILATTIGFYFERDAAKKFDELTALGEEQPVKVLRNGKVTLVARRAVVVGDVVLLETGDEVPADGLLTEASDLQIDESALTGEPIAAKRVLADGDNYHILEVRLLTGRHHQIRCQLAAMGCPIRGDLKYGFPRSNPDGSISLLSRHLEFVHPVSKQEVALDAPLPSDVLWKKILNKG